MACTCLLTLATAASYRHAGMLAKTVATLDVLSGGRTMLGIGAGDYEEEARGLGLPFPALGERFDVLEETVQALISQPHPPILIAGGGERRTLPLVARYADACNIPPSPDIPSRLDLLKRYCEEEGRDDDAIEKTAPFGFDVGEHGEKSGEIIERLRWLHGMGIQTVIGWVVNVDQIIPLEVMGREVIPEVASWG